MNKLLLLYISLFIMVNQSNLNCQNNYNITVTTLNNPAPGYLRFDWPLKQGFAEVDNYGYFVNEKNSKGGSDYFWELKNGNFAQWSNNLFYIYNNNLILTDSIQNPTSYTLDFHDFISLSNGHYLMLLDKYTEMDLSNIIEGGKTDAIITDNILLETDRNGVIYWQWSALEHFSIKDATKDIDLKQKNIDFAHINSMDEDANGNILISIRHFDEIVLIDKATGNLKWRLGGSESKNNQFVFLNDASAGFTGFSHQHTAKYIDNGNILMFDNGNLKNPQVSRAVEYSVDVSNKMVTNIWEYKSSPAIYNSSMGSAYRLPNGNTLISWSRGKITEVKLDKTIALELTLDQNFPFYRGQKITVGLNYNSKNIASTGDYDFSGTGIKFTIVTSKNYGMTNVQKHSYPPNNGVYADSTFSSILPYRWVFTPDGNTDNISGVIKINTTGLTNADEPEKLSLYKRNTEGSGNFTEISSNYISSTKEIIANFSGFGEFVLGNSKISKPVLLSPVINSFVSNEGTVTWKSVTGAIKYQIQIDNQSIFGQPIVNTYVIGSLKFNFTDLNFNSKYYWRVRALNNKDTTDWSEVFYFNTNVISPVLKQPVNNFIGVKLADSLSWNSVEGATSYQVQIALSQDFTSPVNNTQNITSNNLKLKNLLNDVKYFWRVRAFKGNDSSKWSEIWIFKTVLATPYPALPELNSLNIPENYEFQWSSVTGVDSYTIQISESKNFDIINFNYSNILMSKIIASDLEYNKQYFWRIKALRFTDSSDWSEVWNFYTLLAPPELVSPQADKSDIPVDIRLVWKNELSESKYKLQVSRDYEFKNLIIDTTGITDSFYQFNELHPNTSYFWRVKSYKNNIESAWSSVWLFSTGNGLQMSGPKLISPLTNSENISNGSLFWAKKNKALTYRVQISKNSDFKAFVYNISGLTGTEFKYSDLEEEIQYFWRVKAYSQYDSSQWSETWNFTAINPNKVVTLMYPGNDALQISPDDKAEWSKISDIDYYTIQIAPTEDFNGTIHMANIQDANTYPFKQLEMNVTYYWRVRFVRDGQPSNWSAIWSFTTKTPKVLTIPKVSSPANGMISAPVEGEIEWDPVEDASEYQLSFSDKYNFNTIFYKQSSIKETKFHYNDLEYGTIYFVRVSAANNESKSNWSVPIKFITELEHPVITYPANNSINIPKEGSILWDLKNGHFPYHIQISTDIDFENIFLESENFDEQFFKYELNENTEYFCRVKTYNDSNFSRWSDAVKFKTVSNGTAVKYENKPNYLIYPNPASEEIFIAYKESDNQEVSIWDLNGRILIKTKLNMGLNILNIKDLIKGVYILKFEANGKVFIKN